MSSLTFIRILATLMLLCFTDFGDFVRIHGTTMQTVHSGGSHPQLINSIFCSSLNLDILS